MELSKSPVVIYHAGCWDGFCAAWLLQKCFPDAEFHAAHYGTEPPEAAEDKSRRLFVVDFSYDRSMMFRLGAMRQRHSVMTVLDHHKTAQEALGGLSDEMSMNNAGDCEVIFDMNKSGGRLTWEYLVLRNMIDCSLGVFRTPLGMMPRLEQPPWIVSFTEDRDLWRWQLDDSKAVNACLRSHPLDFGVWDHLGRFLPSQFVKEGNAILRREQQIIDDHIRHAREIEMDGHKILCVNATVLFSDIAGELAKDRPFGACYFDRHDGKRQWSLRSRDEGVDVSEIAKNHGGGGHKNAAGFEEQINHGN